VSDYLWDKKGPPDPEVAELEQLLSPLAYRGKPPSLPRSRRTLLFVAGAACAAVLALVLAWRRPAPPSWAIQGGERLVVGAWLETRAHTRLDVADIGTLDVSPSSRLRIVETGAARHRVELAVGEVTARITAPPRRFIIETPSARVIDLGCAFRLSVDEMGQGTLLVTEGSVALADRAGREVVVPTGARSSFSAERISPPLVPAPPQPVDEKPAIKTHAPPPSPPAKQQPTKAQPPQKAPPPTQPAKPPTQKNDPLKLQHDPFKDMP
jgi:ferric-dicitrate binding protein FerR (iron transport regulator)